LDIEGKYLGPTCIVEKVLFKDNGVFSFSFNGVKVFSHILTLEHLSDLGKEGFGCPKPKVSDPGKFSNDVVKQLHG
jgi:hypothetical protein